MGLKVSHKLPQAIYVIKTSKRGCAHSVVMPIYRTQIGGYFTNSESLTRLCSFTASFKCCRKQTTRGPEMSVGCVSSPRGSHVRNVSYGCFLHPLHLQSPMKARFAKQSGGIPIHAYIAPCLLDFCVFQDALYQCSAEHCVSPPALKSTVLGNVLCQPTAFRA